MNWETIREQILNTLALGLDEWPCADKDRGIPEKLKLAGCEWCQMPASGVWVMNASGHPSIMRHEWFRRRIELGLEKAPDPEVTPEEDEAWSEARMDAIGQNGHHPEVYGGVTPVDEVEFDDSAIGTGLKYDGDKVRMDLLTDGMPRALEAVGEILTFGAKKYKAHSWKTVAGNTERYNAAKVRHMIARAKGEERDPESGLLHLAHEACNALFLLELALLEGEQ